MTFPLSFRWRHLCYAHWRVDRARLARLVPDALAVETVDGSAWLSVVALRAVRTRPRGLPGRLGTSFAQVNCRTYVTGHGAPGVYFLSLDAGSLAGVLGARLCHWLPYHYATTTLDGRDERVEVRSRRRHPGARPAQFAATVRPDGDAFTPAPDAVPGALTARDRLYTQAASGRLRQTRVDHPPIRLRPATGTVETNTLFEANGLAPPGGDPLWYYSRGVDVTTSGSEVVGRRVR